MNGVAAVGFVFCKPLLGGADRIVAAPNLLQCLEWKRDLGNGSGVDWFFSPAF